MRANAEAEFNRLDAISRTRALSQQESNRLMCVMRSIEKARIRAQAAPPPPKEARR